MLILVACLHESLHEQHLYNGDTPYEKEVSYI